MLRWTSVVMRKILLGLCAILLFYAPAATSAYTGNELLSHCEQTHQIGEGFCMGFIYGVDEGFYAAEFLYRRPKPEEKIYCKPANVTAGQMKDIVIQYLRQNPQTRHQPAGIPVLESFQGAFPCRRG